MGYSNPEFLARYEIPLALNTTFGTFTASGSNAITGAQSALPQFIRRTRANKVKLVTRTIPNASATGLIAVLLNGTNTFGTVALTTATAGQQLNGVISSVPNSIFAKDTAMTINVVGTSTASGGALGAYDILVEAQEQYE